MRRSWGIRIGAMVVLCGLLWSMPFAAAAEEAWFRPFLNVLEKNNAAESDSANAFGLIDIDFNGTPELIVGVWDASKKNTYAHIYRYVGGQVRRCGSVKMGSMDWDMEVALYTDNKGRPVWVATTADARKVEADVRDYALSMKGNGDIQAKEIFRYRILFSGKATYYVNGSKVSAKVFRKKHSAWQDKLTPVDEYVWETRYAGRTENISALLREAADEYYDVYSRI